MKNLKSIGFDKETVTVTYKEGSDVPAIVDWLFYNHELKNVTMDANSFTFDYVGQRFLGYAIKDFICKTCSDVRTEKWTIDEGTYCTEHLRVVVDEGKLFRITIVNGRGTIGVNDFGCWQYGRILTIHDIREGVKLELVNSFLDGVSHELLFEENGDLEVIIEIGDIQF